MSSSTDNLFLQNNAGTTLHEPTDIITLNVGGERHQVLRRTLASQPDTRLGKLERATDPQEILSLCDSNMKDEFFFDRAPQPFVAVLQLHRTGHLHLVDGLCSSGVKEDLDYWGVNEAILQPCCQAKYIYMKEEAETEEKCMAEIQRDFQKPDANESMIFRWKNVVWKLLDNPASSIFAKVLAVISILVTLLLITIRILASLPGYFEVDENGEVVESPLFFLPETACVVFIAFLYIGRLISAPKASAFIKNSNSVTDLTIIVSFANGWKTPYQETVFFRIVDVLSIVKSWCPSLDLMSVLKSTMGKELIAIVLILCAKAIVLGSSIYYFEMGEEDTKFENVVDGIWWAAVTLVTMGCSDDMQPQTLMGKCVGFLCYQGGWLILAILIAIVNSRYVDFCNQDLKRKMAETRLAAIRAKPKEKLCNDVGNSTESSKETEKKPKKLTNGTYSKPVTV